MNDSNDELRELEEVADRLRRERPQVSELELDQIKVRAMRRAPADRSSTKGRLMYSRLVITTMLVVGMLMALSGVGVANGVFDGDGSASVAQYGDAGDEGATVGGGEGAGGVRADTVQAEEQVTAAEGDGELPLTGFLAIPLIAIGAGLVVTGAVLRRRVPRDLE
jgi:hypothetical protein